jgi:hypothetical protein
MCGDETLAHVGLLRQSLQSLRSLQSLQSFWSFDPTSKTSRLIRNQPVSAYMIEVAAATPRA